MTITFRNLRLQVILGVHESERLTVRDAVVNLTLDYDADKAAATDNIADAVDYKEIRDRILAVTRDSKFHLIEALLECIGSELRRDPRISGYRIEIDKPGALRLVDSVSVATSWKR